MAQERVERVGERRWALLESRPATAMTWEEAGEWKCGGEFVGALRTNGEIPPFPPEMEGVYLVLHQVQR